MMDDNKADQYSVDSPRHRVDFTDSKNSSDVIPSLGAVAEPLCTVKTMLIVFVFEIFMSSAYYVALSIGLLKYLSWGLSIIEVVQATLIFTSVETFAQVFAATLSDKTRSITLGRRKPFILVGNLLQFVSVFFLCMPPSSLTSKELYAWYISFSSVSWGGFMLFFYPFKSWLIEQAVDDRDYQTMRGTIVPIGALFGGISGTLVLLFTSTQLCAYYNLFGGIISLILMVFFTPSHPPRIQNKAKDTKTTNDITDDDEERVPAIIPSIRLCAQCKEFRQVFVNQVFVDAAISTFSTILVLLVITSYNINKESSASMLYVIISIVGGIIGVACNISCHWVLQRFDKLQVYNGLLLITIVACILVFLLSLNASNLIGLVVLGSILTIVAVPINLIYSLFVRDLVIFDTFVTAYKRENMYISAIFIPSNILSKFLSQIPIVAITLIGFSTNDDVDDDEVSSKYSWTEGSVWAIRVFSSFFIVLFAGICYVVMRDYPLNTKVVNQMSAIIDKREAVKKAKIENAAEIEDNLKDIKSPLTESVIVDSTKTASTKTLSMYVGDAGKDDHDNKQLLLHLSKAELYRILSPAPSSSVFRSTSVRGLQSVFFVVVLSLLCSLLVMGLLITALVVDSQRLDGLFSTLLMYLVLLMTFLIAYELFRVVALSSLYSWSHDLLQTRVKVLYDEILINEQKMTVSGALDQLNHGDHDVRKLSDLSAQMVVSNDQGSMSMLYDYEYIALLLIVCSGLSVFVIVYGFYN